MKIFKPYSNIKDFLYRFTILKIGKLHIRIHNIKDSDKSTLMHNHPFHYISIILKGGYSEKYIKDGKVIKKTYKFLSVIIRKNSVFHRITSVKENTFTLFIAFGNYGWRAYSTIKSNLPDGVFLRTINGKEVFAKRKNGIWFVGNQNLSLAILEQRHSIHQIL